MKSKVLAFAAGLMLAATTLDRVAATASEAAPQPRSATLPPRSGASDSTETRRFSAFARGRSSFRPQQIAFRLTGGVRASVDHLDLRAPPDSVDHVPLWRIVPDDPLRFSELLHRLANQRLAAGDSAVAEACWSRLVTVPNLWIWEAANRLGAIALARGDSAAAESALDQGQTAVHTRADFIESRILLARLMESRGNSWDALGRLFPALSYALDSPRAGELLNLIDRLAGEIGDSAQSLGSADAARLASRVRGPRAGLGRLERAWTALLEQGRARSRPFDFEVGDIGYRLAEAQRAQRLFDRALATIQTAESLARPSMAELFPIQRARTLRDAGRTDSAFAEYRRIIADQATGDRFTGAGRGGGMATLWWEVAREAEEIGRWSEAHSAYQSAQALQGFERPEFYLREGLLFIAEHDPSRARACFARDTLEAGRFWWALAARDSAAPAAESTLRRLAASPGFGYYAVCARDSLGIPPARPPGDEIAPRSDSRALQLATSLAAAGIEEDAITILDAWSNGEEWSDPLRRTVEATPLDLLYASDAYRACARPAAASRAASRAFARPASRTSSDSSQMSPWAAVSRIYLSSYEKAVDSAARDRRNGIDPALLRALIWQESRFDSAAVSRTGARGLTQLMPATARDMARRMGEQTPPESARFDPSINVRLGARHLRQLLDRFGGNVPKALAAYNSGVTAVERWSKLVPGASDALFVEMIAYGETRDYVKNVLAARAAYRELAPREAR